MEDKCRLPFPYEYWELELEEKEEISKSMKSINVDYVRLGPKGYLVARGYRRAAEAIYNMPLRTDDVFVMSFKRSGTTCTQELVWLLANNLDYTAAAATPLARRYNFLELFMACSEKWKVEFEKSLEDKHYKERALQILTSIYNPVTDKLTTTPSPRLMKSHLPLSLLPPGLLDTAKVVYLARDPRDVAVSVYHLNKLFDTLHGIVGTFKDYWNLFLKDLILQTPYFVHVKEAWEKRHHPNMLFLFYEELLKDLPTTVQRVADFMNKDLTTEELDRLCDHLKFDNFKKNNSVNFDYLKEYGFTTSDETFIRKGKSGGWREYFDAEMTQQAEQWMADNLRDTDLRFPEI